MSAEDASAMGSDAEGEDGDDTSGNSSLFARTYAVLKGELVMSQLLEPEMIHFLVEFNPLLDVIFNTYVDVPVPNLEGHMTLNGFLQCCSDFGIFPARVDFQTLQWIYHSAENTVSAHGQRLRKPPPRSPEVDVSVDSGDIPQGSASIQLGGAKSSTSAPTQTGAKPAPRASAGKPELEPRAVKRNPLKKHTGDSSPGGRRVKLEEVLWSGKWIKSHLLFLTKDSMDMTEEEKKVADIVNAMTEWLSYRRLTIADVLAFLVPEKDKGAKPKDASTRPKKGNKEERDSDIVSIEVFAHIIDFMKLEEPPSADSVQQLYEIISGAREEVDFGLLKDVFRITARIKDNLERAANFFMKDSSHMDQQEYSASMFFHALVTTMEANHWTPRKLYRKLDHDGSGKVDKDEMDKEVRIFMKTQPIPVNRPLPVESPFNILDLNQDEWVSEEEFLLVFEQVEEAKRAINNAEVQHPLFVSASSGVQKLAPGRRMFGRRAFIECLMKVALVHLSFHSTTQQAEQISMFKASWLLTYMRWQFESAKAAPKDTRKQLMLPPMKRLMREHPDLFEKHRLPQEERLGDVWGQVDDLLHKSLADEAQPIAAGSSCLDSVVLALAVG